MARDRGLEELLGDLIGSQAGLDAKPMFGGLVWLLDGRLLCGARQDGALFRLGKGQDAWALAQTGIAPMLSGRRAMTGWVWVAPEAMADEALGRRLVDAALAFVRGLPPPKHLIGAL